MPGSPSKSLPGPGRLFRLLASPPARLICRPWFDRLALRGLAGYYFPISRAWAAATVAGGDLDRFVAALPIERLPPGSERSTRRALARVAETERVWRRALGDWDTELFGGSGDPAACVAAEMHRRQTSHAFMGSRFGFSALRSAVPAVRLDIATPEDTERRHGARLRDPASAYALPDPLPRVDASPPMPAEGGRQYWLRFPSPLGDTVWAHVFEPEGVTNPPSLIYGHGLAVEIESLDGIEDSSIYLPRLGARLVRPELPWHNRRRLPGTYGGEPVLAGLPSAAFDFLPAAAREFAILVAWCRARGSKRVGVGGVSLGGLVAQSVLSRAHAWPAAARPDAGFLVTVSGDVVGLALGSSLARALGVSSAVAAAGWTPDLLARWRPLVDPLGGPVARPEDIVMVLGQADDLTPFADGLALARRWRVPPENLYLRHQGHFSATVGLMSAPEPWRRLARILGAG